MDIIEDIIATYGIRPVKISQITDRVYRIDDGYQQYALKKSKLTNQRMTSWERTFHDAYKQQLSSLVPLFLTINNSLHSIHAQNYYYLTPWITGEQATIEQLYRCIGKAHKQTKKSQTFDHDQMIHEFRKYEAYCAHVQESLLSYVKRFESHIYMSPLELQVCTHYRDVELVCKKIRDQISRLTNDEEKSLEWSYSLCHGNLKLSHSLEADQTYLINWEQMTYEHPMTDLVIIFKNELLHYDSPIETWIDSFEVYMEENKLSDNELTLLLIHLLDPTSYITIVQQYMNQTSDETMIHQMKKLQTTYRQLLFALQFLNFVDQHYFSNIENDLDL